jgi:hypothetical protein
MGLKHGPLPAPNPRHPFRGLFDGSFYCLVLGLEAVSSTRQRTGPSTIFSNLQLGA